MKKTRGLLAMLTGLAMITGAIAVPLNVANADIQYEETQVDKDNNQESTAYVIWYKNVDTIAIAEKASEQTNEYMSTIDNNLHTETELERIQTEYYRKLNRELIKEEIIKRTEVILAELGIDSNNAECSSYAPVIICQLTDEQIEIASECELIESISEYHSLENPHDATETTESSGIYSTISSDESDEGSFVYDFITANDNAFPTDIIFNEYNLVTELGNDGCWINFDLESGVFRMSGCATQSFSIFGSFERKGNDLYMYPENASVEFYVLHREHDHFISQSEEKGVNLTEGLVFYADNDDFWEILPDQATSEDESNNITTTDLNEYHLVTELGDDGCWIHLDLVSGDFRMSGCATQSFSIFGSFERKGNDLYMYPENASVEFYVLHREHDHFISQSEEKGVNLTEGLVFYADNDDFWEILPDQAHSENESTDTGDTSTTKSNIASDDELAQWAINDYQDKTGITAASAEVRTVSDEEYAIAIKDSDGNILDTYIINPETGVGTNSSNEAVDLPQTGMSRIYKALPGLAALLTLTGVVLVKKSRKEGKD